MSKPIPEEDRVEVQKDGIGRLVVHRDEVPARVSQGFTICEDQNAGHSKPATELPKPHVPEDDDELDGD